MLHDLEDIDDSLVKKKSEFEALFSLDIGNILVNILSKEEFKKFNLRDWVVAFATPQKKFLTIVEQKDSGRSPSEWLKVIVHEIVHIFYVYKFNTDKPVWFFEGLACYLADQKKKDTPVSFKDLIDHFSDCNEKTYVLGYNAVKNCFGTPDDKRTS